ncbi:conserved protein of unknown function [Bradyrhizobium sp. ORS 285]|nr:conserved protein of unknown function [Bradyrhizobium sp. ORS 285]
MFATTPRMSEVKTDKAETREKTHAVTFSRRIRARALLIVCPSGNRGRREDRERAAPMAPVREKMHGAGTTGLAGTSRPSLRNGFTAYSVLSPGTGCLAPVASAILGADLTSASGGQDHTA